MQTMTNIIYLSQDAEDDHLWETVAIQDENVVQYAILESSGVLQISVECIYKTIFTSNIAKYADTFKIQCILYILDIY